VETEAFEHAFTRYAPAVTPETMKKAGMLKDPGIFPDPDLL
jgi:hypothetical protein